MKRICLAVMVMMALLLTSVPVAMAAAYTGGTYNATADGKMGAITVEVVFSDDAIVSVNITQQNETVGLADGALTKIPAEIVEGQTLAIDAVAGATVTSQAILDAVAQCVALAGGDVDALKAAREVEAVPMTEQTLEADVVIVGAGGAGLSAAVAAAQAGSSVIVVEKMGYVGGTTALSSGLVQIAGTEQQRAYGIEGDTWEIYANDIYTAGDELGSKELIDTICKNANDTMEWLSGHGIVWQDTLVDKHGEDVSFLRTHAPVAPKGFKGALGAVLTDTLAAEAQQLGAKILLNTKAESIITEGDAAVGIAAVNHEENVAYAIKGKAVIMATGGFAASPEMSHQYTGNFPVDNTDYRAFPGSLGEGIKMGEAIGAALVDMQYTKQLLSSDGYAAPIQNAIYVNAEGKRFCAEDGDTTEVTSAINDQTDGHCFILYDGRTIETVDDGVKDMIESGALATADTLEELAEKLGIDAAGLVETVANFNAIVAGEAKDEFGREKFGNTIEVGPFYASERHSRMHYTMGGLKIDAKAHVISTADTIIPGLYAAGETTGGVHGNYRVGANALSEIFVMGRIAGETAVAELQTN